MHDDLRTKVSGLFPGLREDLIELVRIPSVSAPGFDPAPVRQSAEVIAGKLREAGCAEVQLLEVEGAHPAVYGSIPAPPGAPTVLLYAHHDVQPPGPAEEWQTGPFEPFEEEGRLYGRGASDDKAGVVMHLGALRAFDGRPPVGVKVFVEGEEEMGSSHLPEFLDRYFDLLAADVIIIGDAGVWRVGQPALFTSLRGVAACVVQVRTIRSAVHSGSYGGLVPDALTALCRMLATLHDDEGNVAIKGLTSYESDPLDVTEAEVRMLLGTVEGLQLLGSGELTSRVFSKPAVSVLAIDAPPVEEAINQLVPVARAKVSLRTAPGQDGQEAIDALIQHLIDHAPWGVEVKVESKGYGDAFSLDIEGPAYESMKEAMKESWGVEPVMPGIGGSIPFVASFSEKMAGAPILLIGAGDPTSAIHAPNESQDLADLEKVTLAEAVFMRILADRRV